MRRDDVFCGYIVCVMRTYLDFEKPVAELEAKVEEMRACREAATRLPSARKSTGIEAKADQALKDLYATLTPWQKTQVARHPQRPHCLDYIAQLITDFVPLAGDRSFGDDAAIVAASAVFAARASASLARKKAPTRKRLKHNFGMARPEGYRKAVR